MSGNEAPGLWDNSIPNQSPALVLVSVVLLLVSTGFFATRLAWRFKYKQRGWDDLIASVAWMTLVVQTAFGGMAAHYGFGKHRQNITSTFPRAMFYFYLYQILYKILGTFTKLTFCFLYLRLFSAHGKFKQIVWLNIAIILAGGIAFTAVTLWQCHPVTRAWDRTVSGYCINNKAFWYSHSAFNTFMDIVVFVLPIPLIRTLQMAKRTQKGLITLFLLGFFTIIASVVRMALLNSSAESIADPTWGSMPALIWTEIESNTSMICCCIPALRKLAARVWRKATGKTSSSTPDKSSTARPPMDRRATMGQSWRHNNPNPKGFGNFTEIHASPAQSPIILPRKKTLKRKQEIPSSPNESPKPWLENLLRHFTPKSEANKSTHAVPDDDAWLKEDRNHLAPKLELGTLYKDTGYRGDDSARDYVPAWQHSARMSVGGPSQDAPREAQARPESTAAMANFLSTSGPQGGPCDDGNGRPRT
ncbi:hypothetical protein AC579_1648 [Pseudocercospora musae]|uniref:Rhodopsin domain-containing protein n=1 Tax=Pseudocercospora musae TaxID=113226 RepID=A0A139IAM1_9PEZI|nr:hypothetical protein AC579_1648 [Pseudocercospora musae]